MAVMKHENPICEKDSISALYNAVFEKFSSFLKRKLKHFQTVRFLMNFIQNCAILAVHYRKEKHAQI